MGVPYATIARELYIGKDTVKVQIKRLAQAHAISHKQAILAAHFILNVLTAEERLEWCETDFVQTFWTLWEGLPNRPRAVISYIGQHPGASNAEVATALLVSVNTIKTHLRKVFALFRDVGLEIDRVHLTVAYILCDRHKPITLVSSPKVRPHMSKL